MAILTLSPSWERVELAYQHPHDVGGLVAGSAAVLAVGVSPVAEIEAAPVTL